MQVPTVARAEMIDVDRLMIDNVGITLLQMMEQAGMALADHVMGLGAETVSVLAGGGGNGGGVMAAARHLANRGVRVTLVRSSDAGVEATEAQQRVLAAMGVTVTDHPSAADVVIDGLVGYSLVGAPRGRAADLISWIGHQRSPVVSLDLPSGLDADLGYVHPLAVRPSATVTLALPKPGLLDPRSGDVVLADISVPQVVWRQVGVEVPVDLFGSGRTVPLVRVGGGFERGSG